MNSRKIVLSICTLLALHGCGSGDKSENSSPTADAGDRSENSSPTADAGVDQTVEEGVLVSLSGVASSDSDGTIESYLWEQLSGTSVSLSNANDSEPSFTAPTLIDDETLQFTLVVTDNKGKSATDTVAINIDATPVYQDLNAQAILGLNYSDVVSVDLDGDRDMDLVQCGYDPVGQKSHTQIYINNQGQFELLAMPLDSDADGTGDQELYFLEYECVLDVADMDNDGDMDIVGTGTGPGYVASTFLFENKGNLVFTTKTDWVSNGANPASNFLGTNQGFVSFVDINNDKHFEVMLSASENTAHYSTLYKNNADGTFTLIDTPVDGASVFLNNNNGTHAWGDFNGDLYQDLIIIGGQGSADIHLYKNNKDDTFTKVDKPVDGISEFPGLYEGPVSWGDIDGDEDLDILISARESNNDPAHTLVYENLGSENGYQFSLLTTPLDTDGDKVGDSQFIKVGTSEIFLADIDGKNQLDIVSVGYDSNDSVNTTNIYLNVAEHVYQKFENPVDTNADGSGDAQLEVVSYAGATVADLDNDGDMDLIYNGRVSSQTPSITLIYENIEGTHFVKVVEPNPQP